MSVEEFAQKAINQSLLGLPKLKGVVIEMTWQPCEEKDAEAYAVVKDGKYLCTQGDQVWYDEECKGWAICSVDYKWVTAKASETGGGTITPMKLTSKE